MTPLSAIGLEHGERPREKVAPSLQSVGRRGALSVAEVDLPQEAVEVARGHDGIAAVTGPALMYAANAIAAFDEFSPHAPA